MPDADLHIVTGAFGFTGRYIAQALLEKGKRVRTLISHAHRPNPFADHIEVQPLNFSDPAALTESLRGAKALYSTYWVRFNRPPTTFEQAVANTQILIQAAMAAGVEKFVHISVTSPCEQSTLPYFRGKAAVERILRESGISYAILRPTLLFGEGDILINNIAWLLRRLPVFGLFGDGNYRVQPVYVGDVAALAVEAGTEKRGQELFSLQTSDSGNRMMKMVPVPFFQDAVGPETYTFKELLLLVRRAIGSQARIVHLPPRLALVAGRLLGLVLGDVVITREEIRGLMDNLLVSDEAPTCPTSFGAWLARNADKLGLHYASEFARHYSNDKTCSPQTGL